MKGDVHVGTGAEATRVAEQATPDQARDTRLDNLKGVLIALVVLGHGIEPFRSKFDWVGTLYAFIYVFHMPMFAYASGAVSRRELGAAQLRGIIEKLVLPYVALDIAYRSFDYIVFNRPEFELSLLSPFWILWYFVSLIWWRVLLPFLALTRHPLLLAVTFALCSGLYRYENSFAFARTFAFLPFFVLGHYHHRRIALLIDGNDRARGVATVVLLSAFAAIGVGLPDSFNIRWLFGGESFNTLGVSWQVGVPTRFLILCASAVVGLAVLASTPSRKGALTHYGVHSMSVYVLHAVPIKLSVAAGVYQWVASWPRAAFVAALSLALVPILTSSVARELANWLMHPSASIRDALLAPDGAKPPESEVAMSAAQAPPAVCASSGALLPPEAR